MKRLLFLCAVLFSITAVHATDPDPETDKIGTISGKVLDATLREPLPYVNIIIKNISGEILTGGITLEDGAFEIRKIIEGNIIVSVQYIGYKTYNKEVHFGKGNYKVNLGNILLFSPGRRTSSSSSQYIFSSKSQKKHTYSFYQTYSQQSYHK